MADEESAVRLDDDNPWPGLAPYDEGAQRYFHGRREDSAELLRLIRLSHFVALYGKSGLGKSSMLQAGVFPELRAGRFLPVYMRLDYTDKATLPVLDQAMLRLQQEVQAAGADAAPPAAGEGLWAYLQRRDWPIWTRDNFQMTPVLVFDQFEELFSRGGSTQHVDRVLENLADLVGDRLPASLSSNREAVRQLNLQSQQYRVVLSFRSDFLAEVEGWQRQANLPRRESLHLTAMSRERATHAVESAGSAVLEPGMAARIVDFLLTREGGGALGRVTEVEPVLLSLCCFQLNRRRNRPAKIDEALLQTVGEGILKSFYEEALEGMAPRVAVFIEENLILGERYRNSYPRDAAVSADKLTEKELDTLTQRRLLRVDPQGGEPRVELIHDRLVSVVRDARDARRALELRQQERDEAEERARAERERERLAQTESERARVARWRNGLAVAVLALLGATGWLIVSQSRLSEVTAIAVNKAKEAEDAKNRAREELETVRQLLEQQKSAAVTPKDATEQALRSVEDAQAKLESQANAAGSEPTVAPQPAVVAAAAPAKSVQAAGTAVVAAAAPMSPTPAAHTLPLDWRLSSGGCLKGDVAVTGKAEFHVTVTGDNVVVREEFEGSGNGFTVKVTGEARGSASQPYHDVVTAGVWTHPNGRAFKSRGVDRVYVSKEGSTPTRASVLKFNTVCDG